MKAYRRDKSGNFSFKGAGICFAIAGIFNLASEAPDIKTGIICLAIGVGSFGLAYAPFMQPRKTPIYRPDSFDEDTDPSDTPAPKP